MSESTQMLSRRLPLPNEVLLEILSHLRPRDIAACQRSFRQLNDVVVCSQFLQYLLRIGRSGLHDPMLPGYTIPQRIEALERWEATWRNLEAQSSFQVKRIVGCELAGSPCSEYIIRDDFLIATPISGRDPGYSYIDLRTFRPGGGTDPWTRIIKDKLSRKRSTSRFLPEQDLVVITLLIEIHGFSFSRGMPHPRFVSATIATQESECVDVKIVGNHTILNVLSTTSQRLFLHSWNDGRVSQLRDPPFRPRSLSWTVLSHDTIAFVEDNTPTLEVCRIVEEPDSDTPSLRTLVRLGLPPLASQARLWHSYCIPAQTPVDAPSSVVKGRPPRRHPFHSSPEERIVAFVLFITLDNHLAIGPFTIVTHVRTLIAHATTTLPEVDFIPWKDWGPSGTACFEQRIDSMHEAFMGDRLAKISIGSLSLLDFNSARVQNAIRKVGHPSRDAVHSVVKDRVVTPREQVFEIDVVSELPYISAVIPMPCTWESVHNYEEGLAGFSQDDQGAHVNIYTPR
ncbi:hypothetical protein BC826DRAFT_1189623 [Russula brevipes]|nr:hypothetical protein BC826DRAFT_1189623 [Russula brevipes]